MIQIDGSTGEGGGQVLRTALGLSLVTGQPFQIRNIRAGRARPGLLRQHLTAVQAAVSVGGATVEGAELGSVELKFTPGKIRPGEYRFAVGTAGSVTLVLQTVLPALMTASAASDLTLEGGTHNPAAPPADFLEKAFLPILARMGPQCTLTLDRHGFYPAGGGRLRVRVQPVPRLQPLSLLERGETLSRRARVLVTGIPEHVGRREWKVLQRELQWPDEACSVEQVPDSSGPGNVVLVELAFARVTEVVTTFGERGLSAEKVADSAVGAVRRYLASGVPVGEHLADQLLVPMALAGGGEYKTMPLTRHSMTNMDIIRMFVKVAFDLQKEEGRSVLVSIR